MSTAWDARTYDVASAPQQAWAADVLARLDGIAADATVLDVGCGTGRVTEALLAVVPHGHVLAFDASADMVALARERLGTRATVWCQDVLELSLQEPVDAVLSTAALHWVTDHDRLWARLARALRPAGALEIQCGGEGNLARVREAMRRRRATSHPSCLAGRPGSSRDPRKPGNGCSAPGSRRSTAGFRSARRIPTTSTRSSGRRSCPHISHAYLRTDGSDSRPPSSHRCHCHWTTCA